MVFGSLSLMLYLLNFPKIKQKSKMPLYRHFEPLLILAITPFYTLYFYRQDIVFVHTKTSCKGGTLALPPYPPSFFAKQSFVLAKNCYRMSSQSDAQKIFGTKKATSKNSKLIFLEVAFFIF